MTSPHPIAFLPPLDRAWQRMKLLLFHPFDPGRWFVIGFAAFLAGLADADHDGLVKFSERLDRDAWQDGRMWTEGGWQEILDGAVVTMLVGFLLVVGLVLGVVFLWLSSRGRFVFMSNLVTGRAEIKSPWSRYAAQGNSLFLWELVLTLVCLLVAGMYIFVLILLFAPLAALGIEGALAVPLAILVGAVGFALLVTAIYIQFFLHSFVVTIMFRDGVGATEAWRRFKPLFSNHPGSFVAYGLLYFLVGLLGMMALVLGGVLTCCVGLLLLVIPYIGSVISLPLPVTLRYWDLEFLGQFGDDFRVLGPLTPAPGSGSVQGEGDGAVVRPQDLGEDPGAAEPGPQRP